METPVTPSPIPISPLARAIREDLAHLRANWYWFFFLGLALVALGVVALAFALVTTLVTTIFVGSILLLGGVFYLAGSFYTSSWGGFFLNLLAGVLHLAAGFILINHPAEAALIYTLLLAVFFFVEGLFRILAALFGRFREWPLVLLSGVVTLLLGVLIWKQWPSDALWVIGMFVGVDLILNGWLLVFLGLRVRRLPV